MRGKGRSAEVVKPPVGRSGRRKQSKVPVPFVKYGAAVPLLIVQRGEKKNGAWTLPTTSTTCRRWLSSSCRSSLQALALPLLRSISEGAGR